MRCPKCGYISFDHLTTCLNCSKDLSDQTTTSQGTTYNAVPPAFLKFSPGGRLREDNEDMEMAPEVPGDDLDVVDPDLDILINENDQEIEFNADDIASEKSEDSGDEFGVELEEDAEEEQEDKEIEIDLSQFEDTSAEESAEEPREKDREVNFSMDLPDELSDISDLAPPPPPQKEKKRAGDEADMNMMDMDLKLDDFDSDFSLTSPEKKSDEDVFAGLSLDDIDLSDSLENKKSAPPTPPKPEPAKKPGEMDLDSDLNFDLDLGGLTLPPKK